LLLWAAGYRQRRYKALNLFMIILFFLLLTSSFFAQNKFENVYFIANLPHKDSSTNTYAEPEIGWDGFCNMIKYPDKELANNIETEFNLSVSFDTVGNIKQINYIGFADSSSFFPSLQNIIRSIKWKPAKLNGKSRESMIVLPFAFYIKRYNNSFPLVIEGNHIYEKKIYASEKDKDSVNNKRIFVSLTNKSDSIYFIGTQKEICFNIESPKPIIGFDSIVKNIETELFKRVGASYTKLVQVYISEAGMVDSIFYKRNYGHLVEKFAEKLKELEWIPSMKNEEHKISFLSLPLVFYLSDDEYVYPIVVEGIKCGAL